MSAVLMSLSWTGAHNLLKFLVSNTTKRLIAPLLVKHHAQNQNNTAAR